MLSLKSSKKLNEYYNYSNVPLKLYCEILATKDVTLLQISGGTVNMDEAARAWDNIIKLVDKASHSLWYANHVDDLTFISDKMAEYVIVKASLLKLLHEVDLNVIYDLAERGYAIDIKHGNDKYAESIYNNLSAIKNNITQITMKQNEMALEQKDGESVPRGFDSMMAELTMAVGFSLPEDITLARATEYTRLLQRKNAKAKEIE